MAPEHLVEKARFTDSSIETLRVLLDTFYVRNMSDLHLAHGNSALYIPHLISLQGHVPGENPFHQISRLESIDWYRNLHSSEYLNRLNWLLDVPDQTLNILRASEYIVTIPTRGESATSGSIAAHELSYGPGFQDEVGVIVYHNHTTTPNENTLRDLRNCQKWRNVVVVHEQVDTMQTLPMTAKIAYDLAVFASEHQNPFIVRTDADVSHIGPDALRKAAHLLAHSRYFAASSLYSLDTQELYSRFPIFGMIERIRTQQQLLEASHEPEVMYKGCLGIMEANTYCAIGGQKVLHGWGKQLEPSIYDDMEINKDFDEILKRFGIQSNRSNVGSLAPDGVIVRVSAAREVESILAGMDPSQRWHDNTTARKQYGSQKTRLEDLPYYPNHPLLAEPTRENVLSALDHYLFPYPGDRPLLPAISSETIFALINSGYAVRCAGWDRMRHMCTRDFNPDSPPGTEDEDTFWLERILEIREA